uniref:Serpin domain-containing protein n=1 Tax=Meloidogyne javanica TaxID=6303 RepID=A0A915LIP0_MELJA
MEKSEEAIISAQADFAINLLSNVVFEKNKPVESTILSPLSLSMGLAIVYAGAGGETREEFGNFLLLINAIYFKGKWLRTFDPESTRKKDFYIAEGRNKTSMKSAESRKGSTHGQPRSQLEASSNLKDASATTTPSATKPKDEPMHASTKTGDDRK